MKRNDFMGLFNSVPPEVNERFIQARNEAFEKAIKEAAEIDSEEMFVTATVTDMKMQKKFISLVCTADGKTDFHMSNGESVRDMGARYAKIAEHSKMFIEQSPKCLKAMKKTEEYPLPDGSKTLVYVISNKGIYTAGMTNMVVFKGTTEEKALFFLYNQVFAEIIKTDE